MKRILAILVAAVSLFIILQIVPVLGQGGRPDNTNPIKCYQCNSFYDKGCADWFDNKTYPLIPCSNNATKCRKIVQETFYDGHWDVRYIRQCAILGEVGPAEGRWCKERTGTWRVKTKYCHCDNKDGCNTASNIKLNSYITIPGVLLGLLFINHRVRLLPS